MESRHGAADPGAWNPEVDWHSFGNIPILCVACDRPKEKRRMRAVWDGYLGRDRGEAELAHHASAEYILYLLYSTLYSELSGCSTRKRKLDARQSLSPPFSGL